MTNSRSKPGAGGPQYLGPYLIWEPGMSDEESERRKREAEERLAEAPPHAVGRVTAIHLGEHLIWDPTMTSEEANRATKEALRKRGSLPPPPAPPEKTIWDSPGYVPTGGRAHKTAGHLRVEAEARQAVDQIEADIKAAEARRPQPAAPPVGLAPRAPSPRRVAPPVDAPAARREGIPPLHRAPEWVWVLICWVLVPMLGALIAVLIHALR